MSVKSVYNFIPAPNEEKVFKPSWAKQVSHDIPFSDGVSGVIDLTVTARSPIFIRNGHSKKAAELYKKQKEGHLPNPTTEQQWEIDNYLAFSHIKEGKKKKYFIPGTSLKGMIRNTLEIMSFSRLKAENDIFSYRDLASRNGVFKREVMSNRNLRTGWLEKVNDKWIIKECKESEIYRIAISEIENRFGVDFDNKTAAQKYNQISNGIEHLNFKYDSDLGRFDTNGNLINKTGELYYFANNGNIKGHLVFYGSIDNKKYEYIFTEPQQSKQYEVDIDLINRFEKIDKKLQPENLEDIDKYTQWQYLNSTHNPYTNNRIPVFFKANEKTVEHFGFSRLYKMTNTQSLNELAPLKGYHNVKNTYELDLAETIFGTVEDTDRKHGKNRNKTSLKGRVSFAPAYGQGEITPMDKVPVLLSSPKASYFPFYLKDGKTFLDRTAELSGFKKYPVHNDDTVEHSVLNPENIDVQTEINPLPTGTSFESKVRFFNLKPIELGALLSAITLHKSGTLFNHSIGGAKPLGYGKVNIEAELKADSKLSIEDYVIRYEEHMTEKMREKDINWIDSDAMKGLFAMSKDSMQSFLLKYPEMEKEQWNDRKAKFETVNEFNEYKKEGLVLEQYSVLLNNGFTLLKSRLEALEGIEELDGLNDFNKGKKIIAEYFNANDNAISDNAMAELKEFVIRCICKKSKRWYNKGEQDWNLIKKWLGDDVADEWYNEFEQDNRFN